MMISLLLSLSLGTLCFNQESEDPLGHDSLRVASFNIRYASASDGADSWMGGNRRERVIAMISELDVDILGVQEAEAVQVRALLESFDRYAAIGVCRDDGRLKGEASAILYDRLRFCVAESGVFWFGDTSMVPGSKSADAAFPRVCTWARLVDLRSGHGLYVYNTHYDHRGKEARKIASRQIRDHIAQASRPGLSDPVIVMGDFNTSEAGEPYRILSGKGADDSAPALEDTYRILYPDRETTTFSGFKLEALLPGRKIDHVFVGPGWRVESAGIDQRKIDGRYPSDHFPIWAELLWE